MTDRELLESAAKAAGIVAKRDPHGLLRNCGERDPASNIFSAPLWNPITDDGDALRLAVKLGFEIDTEHSTIAVGKGEIGVREWRLDDPYAATRRAIVRAAAAIGEAQRRAIAEIGRAM
jgi:hypothetical protein